jgi:hypothetical protein
MEQSFNNRSYSQEIKTALDLPKDWQSNPVENLFVMADRFKKNISVIVRGGLSLCVRGGKML